MPESSAESMGIRMEKPLRRTVESDRAIDAGLRESSILRNCDL